MSNVSENELIEYAKRYLKEKGFRKKNNRWTKIEGDFTVSFFLQGSCYDKDAYYIRPGIFIHGLESHLCLSYGHFFTELAQDLPERVFEEFERFVTAWTDKSAIKRTVQAFVEWDKRNPLEKRRAGLVDEEKDPVPSRVCFSIPDAVIAYILENF